MDIHIEADNEKLEHITVGAFTERLLKFQYPGLYGKLTKIGALLEGLAETQPKITSLQSIQLKMRTEMDELCRQEEEIIFPLLFRLEQEGKKADSCKPFKTVKYHYSYLISILQEFKTRLLQLIREGNEPFPLMMLRDSIMTFEESLIKVQIHKEQVLFKPFRNCNHGCKAL